MCCEVWSNWRSDLPLQERAELGSTGQPRQNGCSCGVSRCITNVPNIQKLIMLHNISIVYNYSIIIYIFYHTLSYLIYVSTGWNGRGQLCSHRFPLVHCVGVSGARWSLRWPTGPRPVPDRSAVQSGDRWYPLVNIQKTMENHHFQWVNPLFLWPFSIAMLVITRG